MPLVLSSVKALLFHQGKFLLLKEELHKGDIWDLPGGKIEYGESPSEALHREVFEELHLKIEIKSSVGVWFFFSKTHQHQVICQTYVCHPIGEMQIDTTKNPADEHFTELRWVTIEEILDSKEIKLEDSLVQLLKDLREDPHFELKPAKISSPLSQ